MLLEEGRHGVVCHMTKPEVQLPLTERIDRFEKRSPAVFIAAAPWGTRSGLWEVQRPDHAAEAFDNGQRMMDELEERYPAKPEDATAREAGGWSGSRSAVTLVAVGAAGTGAGPRAERRAPCRHPRGMPQGVHAP